MIEVVPTTAMIGAEIRGVDLASGISDHELATIRKAFVDHGVIFFRNQDLTCDQHLDFARRWGEVNVNRFFQPVSTHPEIAEVRKEPDQQFNIGESWHTDHSYDRIPAMGSILYAREVPTTGGDTLWASQYAAYDALSDAMKSTLRSLRAEHSSRHAFGEQAHARGDDEFGGRLGNTSAATQDAVHPVVIRHPLSGRPALYVNGDFTVRFEGWTREESKPLLHQLYEHARREDFRCRFRWEVGSMAIWDNRATQHSALNDYAGERRLMHRITLEGEPLEPFAA